MPKIYPAIELAAVLSAEAFSPAIAAVLGIRTSGNSYNGGDVEKARSAALATLPAPAPHQVAADAVALLRIGARVKRWAERACNGIERYQGNGIWCGTWTEADEAAKDKADARHRTQANLIAARYGATATIGGDPRGFVLRLVLASGRTNTTDRDGWGVA